WRAAESAWSTTTRTAPGAGGATAAHGDAAGAALRTRSPPAWRAPPSARTRAASSLRASPPRGAPRSKGS
ncbi:MAG: hypothetical protein AVDCRST_MAG68-2258, partial [uncultured Gemmatimonadetes bacterium]